MIISGRWTVCEDGFVRPLVKGFVVDAGGAPHEVLFQIDTGADRTLLTAHLYADLGLPPVGSRDHLSGLGGAHEVVQIEARVGFIADNGYTLIYRGQYYCATDPATVTIPLLGRDLLDIFAVVVDRPGRRIALLTDDHAYHIAP